MANQLSLVGTLHVVEPIKQVKENFKVMDFVIFQQEINNTGMTFTNTVKFQATNQMCEVVQAIPLNTPIEVFFGVRGTEYEKDGQKQYFNNLNAYRVTPLQAQNAPPQPVPQQSAPPQQQSAFTQPTPQDDGLPF